MMGSRGTVIARSEATRRSEVTAASLHRTIASLALAMTALVPSNRAMLYKVRIEAKGCGGGFPCAGLFFPLSYCSRRDLRGTPRTFQGVYGPPESATGNLRGVYGPPQSAPAAALPSTITAPDYGTAQRGPSVSLPGGVAPGEELPDGVEPVQSRIDPAMAVRWSMIVPPLSTSTPTASSSSPIR